MDRYSTTSECPYLEAHAMANALCEVAVTNLEAGTGFTLQFLNADNAARGLYKIFWRY